MTLPLKAVRVARGLKAASLFGFILTLVFLLNACGSNERVERVVTGQTMGTTYSVKAVGADKDLVSVSELKKMVDRLLADINQKMSTYIPTSELMQLNEKPIEQWHQLSDDLYEVLVISRNASLVSVGTFDVTVAPLVNLWGFGPGQKRFDSPSDEEIAAVMPLVNYTNFVLRSSDRKITKFKDIKFDLSAVAKGYAVDRVAELLLDLDIADFMIEIGGEIRLEGVNLEGSLWRIGVEAPQDGARSVAKALSLTGVGMATSGDYRNYYEVDGKRISHTINPLTGRPITHGLASVTVVAKTAAEADALATALNVLGPEKGMGFAKFKNLAAYFIIREGDGFVTKYTKQFEQYMP